MRRRLRRGLTSLKGSAGEEAKACLAIETKGVPEGALLEFATSVYMMVQASPEDQALYIFSILDTNGNKQVSFWWCNGGVNARLIPNLFPATNSVTGVVERSLVVLAEQVVARLEVIASS